MADRKPLKVLPDSASGTGGGDSTGVGEFVAGDTLGVVDGGTGLAAVGANQLLTGHNSSTTGALTSESNLTFDGTNLGVGGNTSATNWPFAAELIVEGTYPGIFLKNTTSHADVKNWAIGTTYGTLYVANDTDNTAPFRIDKDGNIGIGGTTPSTYANGNAALVVGVGGTSGSAVSEITIASDDAGVGELNFTDTADTTNQGYVKYDHANTILSLAANTYARFYVSGAICGINETLNAKMTQGLTIQQGTNDNEILTLKSTDVAQPMTGLAEADTFAAFTKFNGAEGGLELAGYKGSGGAAGHAIMITGRLGEAADTTKSTGAVGVVDLKAQVTNGSTSVTDVGSDGNLVVIGNSVTSRFIFDAEGSGHADVEWVSFSDSRLKTNVIDCPYGLAEVLQLEPKTFDKHSGKIEDGEVVLEENSRRMIGFLAQDVKALMPELVKDLPNDESFYSLNDGKLAAVLVNAIKELNDKLEAN